MTPTDCVPSKLYWTDRGRIASISQSNLDGSERTVLVKKDVVWPHDIVVDIPNQRLYWVDSKLHTLETITTSGKDRRILNRFSGQLVLCLVRSLSLVFDESVCLVHVHLLSCVWRA